MEIVERTRAISLDTKKLLGVATGVTSSECIFGDMLKGLSRSMGFSVESQFKVGDYRVDFLVGGKVAVEFDEITHASYCNKRENIRTKELERAGYSIVRVSDKDNIGEGLGLIINTLNKV